MSVMTPFSTQPLVEPVNLVAEQDRSLPLVLESLFGLFDDLAHSGDAFGHSRERLEVPFGIVGDDPGERRLARARRAPEDARADVPAADQFAECFPGSQQIFLPEELLERLGPHARR